MSQHDFIIANQAFPLFRADLNTALQALATQSRGTSAPSTTYPNLVWQDQTNHVYWIRDEADSDWYLLASSDVDTVISKTANYTVLLRDAGKLILGDAGSGVFSFTLPSLSSTHEGFQVTFKKTDSSSNAISIVGTVDGDVSLALQTRYETITILWDGAAWHKKVFDSFLKKIGGSVTGDVAVSGDVSASSINSSSISGMRNRIINGDMRIDQRNAGASVTPTADQYLLDRWGFYRTQSSKLSFQQNAGSVTPPSGFSNYLGATSLSSYSVLSGDYFILAQVLEGYNCVDLAWGTAEAAAVTLSFWVRSSLTGTFGGVVKEYGNSRSYPFTYTVSSANTWEKKTITISGDTSGTYMTTNSGGIKILFSLGSGSTNKGTPGAWSSSSYTGATGETSVVGTNAATFYITGVQFEAGSVASAFERRAYSEELALCQRYYEVFGDGLSSGTTVYLGSYASSPGGSAGAWQFKQSKRALPTIYLNPTGLSGGVNQIGKDMVGLFNSVNTYLSVGAGSTATAEL